MTFARGSPVVRNVERPPDGMLKMRAIRRSGLVLAALLVLYSGSAQAEPYLAVFEGMQCSACHSHPSGGGKRNAFGNVFAQTEMPTRRIGDDDAELWTGEVLEWLSVGGNLRGSYRYVDVPNTDSTSEFRVTRGTAYVEAQVIPNRLAIYIDQQFAPGTSLNREAYIRLNSKSQKFHVAAGQFYLPYGLRLQDDSAFTRQVTGVNFTNPDRGVQVGYESGSWSTQLSLTNGSGGGTETDSGKQVSAVASYVRPNWRAGVSFNSNNADAGDRQMQNVFFGLRTGSIAWLAEANWINDETPGAGDQDSIAGLLEANWRFRTGHNLKMTYDYFDPDDDVNDDQQTRWSLILEFTPMQFLQARFGARFYDGVDLVDFQNRDEYFAELHGFF
jgi:hypothetical protein